MSTLSDPELEIRYPDRRVEKRQLPPGKYRVGREVGDLVMTDPSVSAQHAELLVRPGAVTITDLGSRNGTFDSQGTKLSEPYALAPGQSVRLGECWLVWLPPVGQPGGTQVMAQVPAPSAKRTELLAAQPAAVVVQPATANSAQPVPSHTVPVPRSSNTWPVLVFTLLVPVVALALYGGWRLIPNAASGKKRYEVYEFEYQCWPNLFKGEISCEAHVGGSLLRDSEIDRYKQKLFSDGWELVNATDNGQFHSLYLRREK